VPNVNGDDKVKPNDLASGEERAIGSRRPGSSRGSGDVLTETRVDTEQKAGGRYNAETACEPVQEVERNVPVVCGEPVLVKCWNEVANAIWDYRAKHLVRRRGDRTGEAVGPG
jgi:hypothetical protein